MQVRTILELMRLVGCLFLEFVVGFFFHLPVFLLSRRRARERAFGLILGPDAARRVPVSTAWMSVLGLSLTLAIGAAGCSTLERGENVPERNQMYGADGARNRQLAPGSSFDRQVDELGSSISAILRMDDAQRSLEDDLEAFGTSEPNAFRETIFMLGW